MLKDVTLKITPDLLRNANSSLIGHLGTHFDVMNKEFPLEYTKREAYVFDVSGIGNGEIGVNDIDLSKVHEGMFIGFCTGFIEKEGYGTEKYRHEHPQLSHELIDALLERKIAIIGIDFAGVRRGREHTPADQKCADRNTFVVENLYGLKEVSGSCIMHVYPMNCTGITGLPCRVIAEI